MAEDVTDQFELYQNSNNEIYLHVLSEDANINPGTEIDWLNSDHLKEKYKLKPQYDDYLLGMNSSSAVPQSRGGMPVDFTVVENYKVFSGELDNQQGIDFLVWIQGTGALIFSPHQNASVSNVNANGYDKLVGAVITIDDVNNDGRDDVLIRGEGATYQLLNTGDPQLSSPAYLMASDAIGKIPANFSVGATGAVIYQVPIEVVPGINGMQPSLSLNYNSRGGNGVMGVGWSFGGVSMVHRCGNDYTHDGKAMPITLTGDDNRCFNGKRIIDGRTEIDSFNKITEINDGYEVLTKNGLTKLYTHQVKLGSATYQWLLKSVKDKYNNQIIYSYINHKGHSYLSDIKYSGGKIVFKYKENREDSVSRYLAGKELVQEKLLERVSVYSAVEKKLQIVRVYDLEFTSNEAPALSTTTQRSLLHSIKLCAFAKGIIESCLPGLTFSWLSNIDSLLSFTEQDSSIQSIIAMTDTVPLDWNGDGRIDLLLANANKASVLINNGSSFDEAIDLLAYSGSNKDAFSFVAADLNNDGKDEVIYRSVNYLGGVLKQDQKWKILTHDGGAVSSYTLSEGYRLLSEDAKNAVFYPGMNSISSPLPTLLDFDGDGRLDIVLPEGKYWKAYKNTSTSSGGVQFKGLNGDADGYFIHDSVEELPSISYAGRDRLGNIQLYLHLDDGDYNLLSINSFSEIISRSTTDINTKQTIVLDINGDGTKDIVGQSNAENEVEKKLVIYINKGGVLEKLPDTNIGAEYVLPVYEGSFSFKNYPTKVTDINNDGLSDLVYLENKKFKCLLSNGKGFSNIDLGVPHGGTVGARQDSVEVGEILPGCVDIDDDMKKIYKLVNDILDYRDAFNNLDSNREEQRPLLLAQADVIVGKGDNEGIIEILDRVIVTLQAGSKCPQCDVEELNTAREILILKEDVLRRAASVPEDYWGVATLSHTGLWSDSNGLKKGLALAQCKDISSIKTVTIFSGIGDSGYHFADFNSDGITDIAQLNINIDSWGLWKNNTKKDLVSRFSGAFGNFQEVDYKTPQTTNLYTPEAVSNDIVVQELLAPISLVTSVTSNNGLGNNKVIEYSYAGFKLHRQGRGFLGGSKHTSKNITTGAKKVQQYYQKFPLTGAPKSVEVYAKNMTGEDILVSRSNNRMTSKSTMNTGRSPYFAYIERQIQEKFELDGNKYSNLSAINTYDDYGNITDKTVAVWPSNLNLNVKSLPTNGWLSKVDTTNIIDTATGLDDWLISFLKESKTTYLVSSENKKDGTKRDLSSREVKVININKPGTLSVERTSSYFEDILFRTEDYTYNARGVVDRTMLSGKDIVSKIDTVTSFFNDQYPATTTTNAYDGASPVQSFTYDFEFAQPSSVTGFNGLTGYSDHDAFGRVIRKKAGNGVVTSMRYESCENTACNASPEASYRVITDTGGAPSSEVYYDLLGREVLSRIQQQFSQGWSATKTEYTNAGYIHRVSLPFTGSVPSQWTTYSEYDGLGRAAKITRADGGSTETIYETLSGQQVITVTENIILVDGSIDSRVTKSTFDNRGLLIEKHEAKNLVDSEHQIKIRFDYDAMGNRDWVNINNAVEETTISIFDSAGNLLTFSDPDTGTSIYTYNGVGDMLSSLDGRGQKITYSYDNLSRLTLRKEYKYKSYKTARWRYDNSSYCTGSSDIKGYQVFIGRACKVSYVTDKHRTGYYKFYRYDQFGNEVKTETHTHLGGGAIRHYNANYDVFGRLKGETLDSGLSLSYGYLNGYINNIGTKEKVLWQATKEDNFGNITGYSLGNGLTGKKHFDVTSGRLIGLEVGESASIQDNQYEWNTDGTLNSRQWKRPILQKEYFTYDYQKRLKTQSGISTRFNKTYNYFENGNIKNLTGIDGEYVYGENGAGPHAVTRAGVATYKYDGAGNLYKRYENGSVSGHNITYNSFNKPVSIESDSGTASFDYDADHRRYWQHISKNGKTSGYTFYANGGRVEQRYSSNGEVLKQITYVGDFAQLTEYGTTLAFRNNTQTQTWHYLHRDHLGSVEVITDASGNVAVDEGKEQRFSYDAFGQPRAELGDISNRGFTDHEHLEESGLIHMNGRVYDPKIARFLSADILVQAPEFSQSYNRYSYVFNSPLSHIDPTGYVTGAVNNVEVNSETDIFSGYYSDYETGFFPLDTLAAFGQDVANGIRFGGNLASAGFNIAPITYAAMNGGTVAEADVHLFGMYTSLATGMGAPALSLFSNPAGTLRMLGRQFGSLFGKGANILPAVPTINQQRELAKLTTNARNSLVSDFDALSRELTPGQFNAVVRHPWIMPLIFGTAVESRVARQVKAAQAAPNSIFEGMIWTGRTNAPQDFINPDGYGFDITGGSMSSILKHQARPEINSVITYDSIPSDLGYRYINWFENN